MSQPLSCHHSENADHAQLYELLVAELTDFVVFLLDPDGCIVSWNPGVERILGYTEAEWLGIPAERIYTPEDRAHGVPQQERTQAVQQGRAPDIRWHLRKNGERLYVEGTLVALRDEKGQLLGFSKIMRDITERYRTEETQRTSEQRFRALVSASSDVLYRMSPDWTEMRQLGGGGFIPDTDSPNPNWLQEYIHPDDQPEVLATIQNAVRTKSVFELEHRVRRVDGTLGWTHSRATPVFDAQGEITEWFGAASDITARKAAEAEREQLLQQIDIERQRLQQVFAQAPVAIVVFRGRDLFVELANPVYQALLQGREVVGRRFADVMPDLGQEVWDVLHRVMDTGEPYAANEWHIPYDYDQDGVREDHWFNVAYDPLREPDGTVSGFVGVLTEVTAQVLARQEVERTNGELERVNRSLEEFAYVASHDLQEPLRMVSIYSQLLLKTGNTDPAKRNQYADFVKGGVHRMEELIRDLLTFSRTVHTNEEPVDTADLSLAWLEAVSMLKTRMEESRARIQASPLPIVRGDTKQLGHVFQNLLGNALKYRHPDRVPEVSLSAEREGQHWIVSVRDNGIGFEPQYAQQIFGLFKRLHRDEYPGTGLGLAICQRIIERYGGRMWADSQPGVGSTFFFSLLGVEEERV